MKTADLMVRDWVYFDGEDNHDVPVQIEIVDGYHNEIYINGFSLPEESVKPILLTEDNLKLNGFKNILFDSGAPTDTWKFISEHFRFCLHRSDSTKYWWIATTDADIHIYNVHELQHALRLCGMNELADNWRI